MSQSSAARRHALVLVGAVIPALLSGGAVFARTVPDQAAADNAGDGTLRSTGDSAYVDNLTDEEYDLAVSTAHRLQTEVEGTFVGATAIATDEPRSPCDVDAECPDGRLIYLRLVWEADANFYHLGVSTVPDGPHKAALVVVDPATQDLVVRAAQYRGVAPGDDETLLYGDRL